MQRLIRDTRNEIDSTPGRPAWIFGVRCYAVGLLSEYAGRRGPYHLGRGNRNRENYCCKAYGNHGKGKQTFTMGSIGLKDDAGICMAVSKYAVDCVLAKAKRTRR